MGSTKPKILLILDDEFVERIDNYRYDNRIPTRSEAIRKLIDESLQKHEKKQRK